MLGWAIGVYRIEASEPPLLAVDVPALLAAFPTEDDRYALSKGLKTAARLAVWQTGMGGTDWLNELTQSHQAAQLATNSGYPVVYMVQARVLLPRILDGPPDARKRWLSETHDILLPNWEGQTAIDQGEASKVLPDEWLVVEAWDES